MKVFLIVIGALAMAMGLLWLGQGLGIIRWPASSVMVDQPPWTLRGTALAILGAALVLRGRRRR